MRPSSGSPSARRASVGQRGSRNSAEISGRTSWTLPAPGDALDRAHRLAVHHQVHVDARLGPEEQAGQVGDRRDRRAVHLAGPAQPREHDRHGGVGGDDHVGVVLGDRSRQRPRAEQAQQPAREGPDGQHVLEQPVDDRVGPREEAQLHAVAVLDDRAQHAAHRGEAVDHRDLGGCGRGLDLLRPGRARRRRDPRRRRRRGSGRGAARHLGADCVCVGRRIGGISTPARGRLQARSAGSRTGDPRRARSERQRTRAGWTPAGRQP